MHDANVARVRDVVAVVRLMLVDERAAVQRLGGGTHTSLESLPVRFVSPSIALAEGGPPLTVHGSGAHGAADSLGMWL